MFEPKNIVVCLDGTGNQIEENVTNVLKLYRSIEKRPDTDTRQIVYYDQGVGTPGHQSNWGRLTQNARRVGGLAFGSGLDRNVLKAYHFIARNYQEGGGRNQAGERVRLRDRIYLFGYSRGAHTARVLAAFLYTIGVLRPELLHLAGAALTAYKNTPKRRPDDPIEHFRRNLQPMTASIHFMGLWDTVSSMIIPSGRLVPPLKIESLPNTRNNPAVRAVRHAMSIDESRYMFRLDPWEAGQVFKPRRFSQDPSPPAQDCKQVWFPGFHGDIGGGNDRLASGLSQYPLCWMIKEAKAYGLNFRAQVVHYVALGRVPQNANYAFPEPSHRAPAHSSEKTAWAILERLPKFSRYREQTGPLKRPAFAGVYIPEFEPRVIPNGAIIHEAAVHKIKEDEAYSPVNMPQSYKVETHPGGNYKDW